MKHTISTGNNEQGFVLVLALFMLTICTMIGMAAMSTSTIELDIAGNERVHKETLYQAESAYAPVVTALFEKNAYGSWPDQKKFVDLGTGEYIEFADGSFLLEGRDDAPLNTGRWDKNNQNDAVDDSIPDIRVRLKNQFNLDIDVDKIDVRPIAGGAVEFSAGSDGIGVSTHRIIYNIDSIGTLSGWDNTKNRFARELRLADGTINPTNPMSEVIVGYGYVPW